MRIQSLHLNDYKRFTDLHISCIPESARLVVIIGPNGSGKSSVFDAFLIKSWAQTHNVALSGNREDYYQKDPLSSTPLRSAIEVANKIKIGFHSNEPTDNQWSATFNIRSAYRNEADFRLKALQAVNPSHETRRFERIIDPDQSVSDNYSRMAWKRMSDLDRDAPSDTTFCQYRQESLADLQTAMRDLFTNPTLKLQDFGGVQDSGVFRFSKGNVENFHYKNLSGGEKGAFDLLLDIFVKRSEYQDAIYCIDEPEAHIATALHSPLLKAMLKLVPDKSQLWIATHSIGFARQAFELMKEEKNVVFLDFSEHDFDQPVVIKPQVPNRAFWQMTYKVALDDLSDLIAPENIVICEGDNVGADKGFDANCYNQLFSDNHPDTLFISYGGSNQVLNSNDLMNILEAVAKGVKVWRLIDRDDMTDNERNNKIQGGLCVLMRREIENYLYDPEVLRTFLTNNNKEDFADDILKKRQDLLDCSQRPDDVKKITRDLFQCIRQETRLPNLGNSRKEFALQHLLPALKETPCAYQELLKVIFSRDLTSESIS